MIRELQAQISQACSELFSKEVEIELARPEEKFGDYSTNVALKLSKKLQKPPREIAAQIAEKLKDNDRFSDVSVAGPGFINLTLKDDVLLDSLSSVDKIEQSLKDKVVVSEYSDPNPFKTLHAGHLYTTIVGDCMSNIFEAAGAKVHRVNYGGDVGLHVGKCMWAILKYFSGENPDKLSAVGNNDRLKWLSERYVEGNQAYEQGGQAANEIVELNKRVYSLHSNGDKKSPFAQIYWTCRQWSYDGFEKLYKSLGVSKFEKYYPESTVTEQGLKTVRQHTGKVYEESDGAIVFRGEQYGLHTRVFITKEGIPTYEAKDIGLIFHKQKDYRFDRSVVITANEQSQYMQVVLKSLEQFEPKLADSTVHLTHGVVKLAGGVKMSSRKGNILTADDVLAAARQASVKSRGRDEPKITLGAVKYALLKNRIGGDIVYDPEESVSLEGNSGPYLQYALVRAKSILDKAGYKEGQEISADKLNSDERSLTRKITIYPEVFQASLAELSPHHICTYLYELAQTFNRFYEANRVIGDERSQLRLQLLEAYAKVLESGLRMLGIKVPEKM